jgi:hypothetical protein
LFGRENIEFGRFVGFLGYGWFGGSRGCDGLGCFGSCRSFRLGSCWGGFRDRFGGGFRVRDWFRSCRGRFRFSRSERVFVFGLDGHNADGCRFVGALGGAG